MASSGEVNVVFFMEEVQKYDGIYNKYSKSYKDKYIKMNCWAKIGEKFDMSAADATQNRCFLTIGCLFLLCCIAMS